MAKQILHETQIILRNLPSEQLNMFAKMRLDTEIWDNMNRFIHDQKGIKMDDIYCLHRPKISSIFILFLS